MAFRLGKPFPVAIVIENSVLVMPILCRSRLVHTIKPEVDFIISVIGHRPESISVLRDEVNSGKGTKTVSKGEGTKVCPVASLLLLFPAKTKHLEAPL